MGKLPEPLHTLPVTFQPPRKKKHFSINIKIFANNKDLNAYYRAKVVAKSDVWAGCVFKTPYSPKDCFLGEIVYSVDCIHPGLVAHESNHMAKRYFKKRCRLTDFKDMDDEEDLCEVLEFIVNGTYEAFKKVKLQPKLLPDS